MKINNVQFSYPHSPPLLQGLNLSLQAGHVYGLFGQNGAGKTTLLKIIAGLCRPDAGNIEVLGFIPSQRVQQFLQNICFVPEDFMLPAISLRAYVKYYSVFYPHFNHKICAEMLIEFGLPEKGLLSVLSHGQKKLFLIAFALSSQAKLLLFDEPTNGLDLMNKEAWHNLFLRTVQPEQIVMISTHQVHDVASLIDSVLILHSGKVVLNAERHELEAQLFCGSETQQPAADQVFYSELQGGRYRILRANSGHEESEIDLTLLYKAFLSNTQIMKLFNGDQYV